MDKVSFLIPTKSRPQLLSRFLRSISCHTKDVSAKRLEILLLTDEDDDYNYESLLSQHGTLPIRRIIKTLPSLPHRFQHLAQMSTGNIFFMGSDKFVFRDYWEQPVKEGFKQYPDNVACVFNIYPPMQRLRDQVGVCFLHRTHFEKLGYLIPLITKHYYGDNYLYSLYHTLKRLHLDNRILLHHDKNLDSCKELQSAYRAHKKQVLKHDRPLLKKLLDQAVSDAKTLRKCM